MNGFFSNLTMNNGHLGHIDSSIGIEFIWYLGEKPADFWGYPSFRQTRFCVNSWTPWNAQHGHHFFFAVPNFETYPNATIDPRSVMPMGHFPVGCPSDNQDAPPQKKKSLDWNRCLINQIHLHKLNGTIPPIWDPLLMNNYWRSNSKKLFFFGGVFNIRRMW